MKCHFRQGKDPSEESAVLPGSCASGAAPCPNLVFPPGSRTSRGLPPPFVLPASVRPHGISTFPLWLHPGCFFGGQLWPARVRHASPNGRGKGKKWVGRRSCAHRSHGCPLLLAGQPDTVRDPGQSKLLHERQLISHSAPDRHLHPPHIIEAIVGRGSVIVGRVGLLADLERLAAFVLPIVAVAVRE